MMYTKGIALSIKKDNEFLREKNSHGERQVFLPFGTEYSIYVKNKNNRRAKFQVKIDGKFTHPDEEWYVVNPYEAFDLERFMLDGDMNKGEKFKFVNVEGSGEEPGLADNGLIEITVQLEEPPKKGTVFSGGEFSRTEVKTGGSFFNSLTPTYGGSCLRTTIDCNLVQLDSIENDKEGITVGGTDSHQSFYNVPDFNTKEEFTMRLRLKPVKQITMTVTNAKSGSAVSTMCRPCNGTGLQTDNKGITHYCPECNGKGHLDVHYIY